MTSKATARSDIPPSAKADWIGGHFRSFRKDPTQFLTKLSQLGDVTYFRMGPQPGFFLNHPDLVRDLLVVHHHKFIKGRALQRAKSLLGEGLLTSEDGFHLRQRRMIQPAFHRQRIADYSRSMVNFGEGLTAKWQDGDVREIDKEMMHLTLQIVGKTLFNADVGSEADEVGRAMTSLVSMFDFLLVPFSEVLEKIPLPQTKRLQRAKGTLNSIIYSIINERRRSKEDKGDLLSMLLLAQDEDSGDTMTDEQVRDEALTLFLAGHETTAVALTWSWYLLSQNPDAEFRMHEELDRELAGRLPSFEDLPHLGYTEAVLAESMRLFPPAWAIGRLAREEHEFNGFKVPPKALVLISPFVMHRDTRFWKDPDQFKPERWLEQSVKEAGQRYIYFPFGGGIRRCIGEAFAWAEGTILLATLARKWKLRLDSRQTVGLKPVITLRPKHGMKMQIHER
jgi:cytochrome P450